MKEVQKLQLWMTMVCNNCGILLNFVRKMSDECTLRYQHVDS